jgi:preprotein translocase subunit YajC
MSFLISDAMAQAAPDGIVGAGGLEGLILPIGLVVILYFFMIRPQMKRQKEQKKMVGSLAKGDEVQTEGGIMGKIANLGDNFIQLEIADGVEIKVRRSSVSAVMPKGTLKEL